MRLTVEQATVYRSRLGGRRFLTERAAWRCHVKELLSIRHVDDGCECRYSSTYPEEGVVCVVHNAHNLKLINRGSALLMRWSRSSVADPEQGDHSPGHHPDAAGRRPSLSHDKTLSLLRFAVRHAGRHSVISVPRWVHVKTLCCVGSTTARQLCRDAGVDPDELVGGCLCGAAEVCPLHEDDGDDSTGRSK